MKKYTFINLIIFSIIINIFMLFINPVDSIPVTENTYPSSSTKIKYPHLEGITDSTIEHKIYNIIDDTIFDFLRQQNMSSNAIQYITYTIYYTSDKIVSFSLENTLIMASSYVKKKFFTIHLENAKPLLVSYFLGNNYQNIIKEQVTKQIILNMQTDRNKLYFMDKVTALKISQEQPFYINKKGEIVISFDKYQIAPGYMGNPEFIII